MQALARTELPNLDFLRSVAVLVVVFAHFSMYAGFSRYVGWAGLTGVCIFFVHTSLVLMWSLERDPHVGRFYLRRVFRIYPLWWVILGLTLLLHIPASPAFAPAWGFYRPQPAELLNNILLTWNIYCINPMATGYVTGANVVGASWSLAIEMQMYLFLPALFFLVRGSRRVWPLLLLNGFVMLYLQRALDPTNTSLLHCIPYFLPGVIAYAMMNRTKMLLPVWCFFPYVMGAVLIHMRYGTPRRSWWFCLALGLTLPFFKQIAWQPLVRASHLLARYSYGIYLCHIPSFYVAHLLHGFPSYVRLLAMLTVLLAASGSLYHAVEKPMIRLGSKLAKKIEWGIEPVMNEENLSLEPAP